MEQEIEAKSLYDSTIQEIEDRRQRIEDGGVNCIPSPFKRFRDNFPGLEQAQYLCVTSFTKGGKCFGKGTQIRMADNSLKNVEDIRPHEFVMSPGTEAPKEVLGINSGTSTMYRITSQMYEPFVVNEEHIMYLYDCYAKKYLTMTMKELYLLYTHMKWDYFCRKYKMVASDATTIESSEELSIDPYFYGLWLGDGDSDSSPITTVSPEIVDYLYSYAKSIGYRVQVYDYKDRCPRYNICRKNPKDLGFKTLLEKVCHWSKQHINKDYLNASIDDRYSLLAGIIDTDGYLNPHKTGYEICLQYESLIDDIIDLSRSLGLTCKKSKKYNSTYNKYYYVATICGKNCSHIPVKVETKIIHKVSRVNRRHYAFKIENLGVGNYYGFEVEGNHLFLLKDYTIVHNTQLVSYMFIFELIWFSYFTKANVDFHIIYFALEETKERIMQRFMSWLLFKFSKGQIRISPRELRSTSQAVDEKIVDRLREFDIQGILKYFEEHIEFPTDENPTGIFKYCKKYAEEHGTVYKKTIKIKDEFGVPQDVDVFDHYEQSNPNEYRIVIIDTINLVSEERGWNKKQSMDKMSEYCAKDLRNKYNFSPVVIQQQAFEMEGNESFKLGRLRPSVAGLGDSKYISRDADIVLGLFSPQRFGITEYFGYDITVLKDHIRFLEVIVNRNGEMGGLLPLWFDGAVCDFKEMPKPDDKTNMDKVYNLCKILEATGNYPVKKPTQAHTLLLNLKKSIKHIINSNYFNK